jgi:hypothetical protein
MARQADWDEPVSMPSRDLPPESAGRVYVAMARLRHWTEDQWSEWETRLATVEPPTDGERR